MSFEDFYGQRDSAYYEGMVSQGKGRANRLGVGERPSESHHWVPGIGWTFMPDYEVGESFKEQSSRQSDPTAGYNINVSKESLADAKASGVTNHYVAQGSSVPSHIAKNIRARQASRDWYTGGMDHYNGPVTNDETWKEAAGQWVNERNGKPTVSPWINTFGHDSQNTFERMRMEEYNPFLGREGGWVGGDPTVSGVSEGYRDDSIAAYMKHAFSGEDQIQNRSKALEAFMGWNSQVRNDSGGWDDGAGNGINAATTKMNQRYFDQLGLADLGLEYEGKAAAPVAFVPQDVSGGWNPGGMMTGGGRPSHSDDTGMDGGGSTPIHSNSDGTGITPPDMMGEVGGSFLAAYKAKRDELASKPSVMSLMTELKDA